MDHVLTIRTFDQLRDVAYGFRLARILLSALDLNLFTVMGTQSWTPKALAQALSASERGVSILCRNLASVGLLHKRGSRYLNSRLGRTVLNAQHPEYRGAYLDLVRRQWEHWSSLTEAVRSGRPVEEDGPEDPEYRRAFSWAMHQRAIEAARQVARQLDLRSVHSLLDVGGGPGTYALAFLAKNPALVATVWDRPAALEVAKELAASVRHGTRLSLCAGDFFHDPVPGRYDVMWLSNVVHIYSPEENMKLLRKLRRALNPGGRLVIQDTFLQDPQGLRPLETNLFAVTMLLFTETGNTYHLRDVHHWVRRAGFHTSRTIRLHKGTGDWEGILVEGKVARTDKGQRAEKSWRPKLT
ncbi:MAG: methyltransferase domain-containing protein [Nitrospirae bacterium]|nr:MAG: methyltransferase domain-containing protein [Nitrospirota bacterium]